MLPKWFCIYNENIEHSMYNNKDKSLVASSRGPNQSF